MRSKIIRSSLNLRLKNVVFLLFGMLGLLLGAANLSICYNSQIDWDTAFFVGISRFGFPTCCLHPLLDFLLFIYNKILSVSIGDPLLSLQIFFFLFLLIAAISYGALFKSLCGEKELSLLAVAAFPLFPLIQNLLSYFEDNIYKFSFLIGVQLLIVRHKAGDKNFNFYLAIILFTFTCLVSVDALLWTPFTACLILWKCFTDNSYATKEKIFFCIKCLLVGIISLLSLAFLHDLKARSFDKNWEFGKTYKQFSESFSYASDYAKNSNEKYQNNSSELKRTDTFLFEQSEPILGLQQILHPGKFKSRSEIYDFESRRLLVEKEKPYLFLAIILFHLINISIFIVSIVSSGYRRDIKNSILISIVFLNYILFFIYNYRLEDSPDERYDHFVILLPFILMCYRIGREHVLKTISFLRFSFLQRFEYIYLTFFIVIGCLHFFTNPDPSSALFKFKKDYPGQFREYYFSLNEIRTTDIGESAFLTGYRPLKIVNTENEELSLFSPLYVDRRENLEIMNDLTEHKNEIYLSPEMKKYTENYEAKHQKSLP